MAAFPGARLLANSAALTTLGELSEVRDIKFSERCCLWTSRRWGLIGHDDHDRAWDLQFAVESLIRKARPARQASDALENAAAARVRHELLTAAHESSMSGEELRKCLTA